MMNYFLPSLTVLLIFACLVAYEYIKDLRRDLKASKNDADTAWRLYETVTRELLTLQGKPLPTERIFPEKESKENKQEPFFARGIGPTAIMDRELRREQRQRQPTAADIAEASGEAAN